MEGKRVHTFILEHDIVICDAYWIVNGLFILHHHFALIWTLHAAL